MQLKPTTPPTKRRPISMIQRVRAGFVLKGETLNAWCTRTGVTRQWADKVARGQASGRAAEKLRARIAKAAGVDLD